MYNTKNGGYLGKKIRNEKFNSKKKALKATAVIESGTIGDEQENEDLETIKQHFENLKLTVPNDENVETVKFLLNKTASLRLEMMKNQKVDVLESFPGFFTNPELVSINILHIITLKCE